MSKYTETMNKPETIRATYIFEHDEEINLTTWLYIPEGKRENKMSETNLQHYKEDLKEIVKFNFDNPRGIVKKIREISGCQIEVKKGEYATNAILEWMSLPYKEPILNDKEREYLSAVIKPYKNKVTFIAKSKDTYEAKYFISIVVNGNYGREAIHLPWFKENTMYKNMEIGKHYTLKELGL